MQVALRKIRSFDGCETVLVVDEDRFVRNLLKRTLSLHGYQVLTAADSREAQEAAARHDGPIELLVTDILLSVTDGPELARILSRQRPGLQCLYVSGFYRALTSRNVVPEDQFLTKPFSPDDLLQKVRNLLDSVPAVAC